MNKTKFKDTELGSIPTDWDVLPIDSLIISMNDGPFGTKLKQEHYTLNREARIIQLSNIGENGWNDSNAKYTTFEYSKELPNHIVNPGDVIVAKMMPAGRAIICPNHEARFVQGSDAIKIKFADSIDTRYFIYGTKGNGYLNLIEENTQGSTRQRIAITKYRKFPFIVPPKGEQKKIAEALSDTDALIKELDVLIEKKRAILQGTMQELLTARRRLRGFSEPFIPKKLKDIVLMNSGGTPSTDNRDYYNGNIPFLSISDITASSKYLNNTNKHISQSAIEETSARLYKKGTLLLSMYASIGKVCITKIDVAISQAILGFIFLDQNVVPEYIYYVLRYSQKELAESGQTGTQSNLNKRIVQNFNISIPSQRKEQMAIASVLSDMDSEISELEVKHDKYIAIRQGMMQQLLTGKIRLI